MIDIFQDSKIFYIKYQPGESYKKDSYIRKTVYFPFFQQSSPVRVSTLCGIYIGVCGDLRLVYSGVIQRGAGAWSADDHWMGHNFLTTLRPISYKNLVLLKMVTITNGLT